MYVKFKNLFFPINSFKSKEYVKTIKKRDIPKRYFHKSDRHNGLILCKIKKYSIIECEDCKFIHSYPFPKKKKVKFYETKYYYERKQNYFSIQKSQLNWWKKFIYQD